jgi:hypothetical protein
MKFQFLKLYAISLLLISCENRKNEVEGDDLNAVKKEFLKQIFLAEVEEGPFNMHYHLKTIFFSKDIISLFGEINVYDCMPHGWKQYEGKTYVRIGGEFKELWLSDLFPSKSQQEFLRTYCEDVLKSRSTTYFGGENPLKSRLDLKDCQTFVIDDQFLTIIFQPYVVVSSADGPFIIKIPFDNIQGHWDSGNKVFPGRSGNG